MKLDEFIKSALVQIANGVSQANAELIGGDDPRGNLPFLMHAGNDGGHKSGVAFDVAVVTMLSSEGKGEGGASIYVVDAQLSAEAKYSHEQVSRIRFTVGVNKWLGEF